MGEEKPTYQLSASMSFRFCYRDKTFDSQPGETWYEARAKAATALGVAPEKLTWEVVG